MQNNRCSGLKILVIEIFFTLRFQRPVLELSIQSKTWSSFLSVLLNWRKNSNFFQLPVLGSDSMKRNYRGLIFTIILTHAHFIIDFVGSKRQQLCGESPCSQEWSSPRHLALSTKPRTRPCFGPLHSRGGRRGRRHWHEGRIRGRRRRGGSNIGDGCGGRGGDGSAASANSLGWG